MAKNEKDKQTTEAILVHDSHHTTPLSGLNDIINNFSGILKNAVARTKCSPKGWVNNNSKKAMP